MNTKKSIVELTPNASEESCRAISANLPEWFGIPEANERYAEGVRERLSFGFMINEICIGMITLEFPFENAANIYWMGVRRDWHHKGIGKALLRHAEAICFERQVYSISVETLSPKENDSGYLNTFKFYTKEGFKPLFELNTYSPEYLMVYLTKVLSPKAFEWIDLTHKISNSIPTWSGDGKIVYQESISPEEEAILIEGITEEALKRNQMSPIKSYAFFIKDCHSRILGGLKGASYYGCLYIDSLWVMSALRNRRWGSKLMQAAEELGKRRNCSFISVTTMDWEALPFYLKVGYEIEYTREGFENGSKMFLLRKNL